MSLLSQFYHRVLLPVHVTHCANYVAHVKKSNFDLIYEYEMNIKLCEAERRTAECARWNICCVVDKVFHQMCWLLNGSDAIDSSRSCNLLRNVLTLLLLLLGLSLFSQLCRTIFIFMVNFIHFLMALNDLCYRPIAYRLFCWVIKSLRRSSTHTVETVERNNRSWAFSLGILCFSSVFIVWVCVSWWSISGANTSSTISIQYIKFIAVLLPN